MYQIYLLMSVLLAQLVAHHDHDLPNKPNCRAAFPAPCRSSRPTQSLLTADKNLKNPWPDRTLIKIMKMLVQNFSENLLTESRWRQNRKFETWPTKLLVKMEDFAIRIIITPITPQLIRVEIFPKLRKMLSHERCEKYHGNFWTWSLHHRYGLHCICLVYLHVRYVYDFLWKNTTNSCGC